MCSQEFQPSCRKCLGHGRVPTEGYRQEACPVCKGTGVSSIEMLSPESAHGMLPATPDPVSPSEPWAPTVTVTSSGAATPPFPDRYVGDGPLPELNLGGPAKLSTDAVATIAKRLAAATAGPWNRRAEVDDSNLADSVYSDGWKGLLIARCNQNGEHGADSELIANAPSDIAFLLSQLACRREQIENQVATIDKLMRDSASLERRHELAVNELHGCRVALGTFHKAFEPAPEAIERLVTAHLRLEEERTTTGLRAAEVAAENERLRVELAKQRSVNDYLTSENDRFIRSAVASTSSLVGYRHALAAALTLISAEQTRFDAAEALADRMKRLSVELTELGTRVSSVDQAQEVPSL